MNSRVSREAQTTLDGKWPRLPLMDFTDVESTKPIRELVNDGLKSLSNSAFQECNMDSNIIEGVNCCWIYPEGASYNDIILYIPGGGGIFGTPKTHFSIAKAISFATKYRVVSIDYPKAPESVYPEPQDVVESIYINLITKYPNAKISIIADSFGASLAINLILRAKEKKINLPNSIALLCPFVDFNYEGESYTSLCGVDPSWDDAEVIKSITAAHIGKSSTSDPMLCVLNADLSGFPPTFIQAASRDLILSDSIQLQRLLRSATSPVEFDLWEGLWHDFQANQSIPEAQQATDAVADFIKRQHEMV